MVAKTKQEILLKEKAKYNKLHQAISILPEVVPVDGANVYTYSVDFSTPYMSVKEYDAICEHLVDWELHSYNYLGNDYNNERIKRLIVTHRILVGKDKDMYDGVSYYIEVHFQIKTAAYKKFLHFISDGKCKVETKWVTPKNEPYETTSLSCGG